MVEIGAMIMYHHSTCYHSTFSHFHGDIKEIVHFLGIPISKLESRKASHALSATLGLATAMKYTSMPELLQAH
jgi:hypothetical protein